MSNEHITQVGETQDGKQVVQGVWTLYETHGLPLDIALSVCQEKGWIPDWIDLYMNMRRSGMDRERTFSKLEEAINDSFGKEFGDVVIKRLSDIFKPVSP
jgi:alanyl-tRNA synthetase